ncbi:MAG: hypothetical protein ASARMPRED_000510 [Alectoria sarmentosa]|nr:MAG: hypothetical protein ASARMPRED_000510 [Alectoria sarmentosa]
MEVTIVDSEPSLVALIDCLDRLPTQPPSLYLDIEGVKLSRHGSISILQLFVLPKTHVFLIDVFTLQEKAFCTANRSGTDLRSILESVLVPKVFFDVRNDSDALFAHFQISMQGVHDVQLLEVATRSFSKERVAGLAKCIEKDTQLSAKVSAAWKATKQKGVTLFAPEHGGSYEVFNSRPMLQDIIDYCTQDVVYLPVLWKVYTCKISARWLGKVQKETCARIRESQTASYKPNDKNKSMSPWANPATSGQRNRRSKTGVKGPVKKTVITIEQSAATEVEKKTAATQPDAESQSQSSVGQAHLRRSVSVSALEAAQKTAEITAKLESQLSMTDLAFRSKNELGSDNKTGPILHPATIHPKWTCTSCHREMEEHQKEEHLAGKQHKTRPGKWTCITCSREMQEDKREEHLAGRKHTARAKRAATTDREAARQPNVEKAKDTGRKDKKRQAVVSKPQQRGLPYPPDHIFSGFRGSMGPGYLEYETVFSLEDENYGLCDKDCGWCGHCMDGLDI